MTDMTPQPTNAPLPGDPITMLVLLPDTSVTARYVVCHVEPAPNHGAAELFDGTIVVGIDELAAGSIGDGDEDMHAFRTTSGLDVWVQPACLDEHDDRELD